MSAYKQINNVTGWIVFMLAACVYLFTMEPTVSLWDCGEFISAAFKLQVGHPPGAPFYLMLARLFALIAHNNSSVAVCINSLSAIASAFTILFLFWTITHLSKKVIPVEHSRSNLLAVITSGVVGALAFCFSDSFWMSATEAEVYGLSSLITAIVFWCILKWEEDLGMYKNRWLILIFYLMGISIGVHLLNLLVIPAIVLIFYFKTFTHTPKKLIIALFASLLLLFFVLDIFIPGTVYVASLFEMLAVNVFQMPVNSGMAFFILFSLTFLLVFSWYFQKNKKALNFVFLALFVMLLGYSSYAMIIIRAQANTPINTGNPSNVYSLKAYLNRDQYGNAPLFYGPYYNAPRVKADKVLESYVLQNGKYKAISKTNPVTYDSRFMTVFPRMYSSNLNHIQVYKDWGGTSGTLLKVQQENGISETRSKPGFINNLQFFLSYQVGYMYVRYFLWNFAGKQNDLQGNGGMLNGNWISGFNFIDQWFIGPQHLLPDYLKNNPGRNRYFLLPLLLGILGMIIHYRKSRRYFFSILLFFLFTGLAIVIYTNQTPLQPRERDYVYVGSFYAFSVWIGFGTLALFKFFRKFGSRFWIIFSLILALIIPILMFSQNFDDHNRHGRYIVRDMASNYLQSCDAEAILFSAGDNDTYPLWYLQEVEGIRTDVRVVNLSLLSTPWYVSQQKQRKYNSKPLPLTLSDRFYENNSWIRVYQNHKAVPVGNIFEKFTDESTYEISTKLKLNVNNSDTFIEFSLPSSYLFRNETAVLDIISNFNWQRYLYFTSTDVKGTIGLDRYLQLNGFSYKLESDSLENSNIEKLYDILMKKAVWHPSASVYLDGNIQNMLSIMKVRRNYVLLSSALAKKGKYELAKKVLDKLLQIMPFSQIPCDQNCIKIAEAYCDCKAFHKASLVKKLYEKQLKQELEFYNVLLPYQKSWLSTEHSQTLYYIDQLKKVKCN